MKLILSICSLALLLGASSLQAGDHDPKVIIPLLKDAKMSLLEGIAYGEKMSGPVTSAKYEVEDGKLLLSIYTVPEGLGVEPEKATLTELGGDASQSPFKPSVEVFTDKEHLTRASVHMTLFQLSPYSLKQIVGFALKKVPGTPIDVRNPMVRNRRAVADVIIADAKEEAHSVTVDLLTGATCVNP